jgi:protein-disulfide isomerase
MRPAPIPATPPSHRSARPLATTLLVLGLVGAPSCRTAPVAAAPTELAHGSEYVQAAPPSDEPAPAPMMAAAEGAPRMRILAADVAGEHDDLVGSGRMRAEYDPSDPSLGATEPLVTIVAFLDYQCPFSKRLVPTLYELAQLYPSDVRVVIKHHPLPMHANARFAATAAVAAMQQGRFWVMHDALFEGQSDLGHDAVLRYAGRLGFDLPLFQAVLDDPMTGERVDADAALARRLGANGTPSMFINGQLVSGAVPLSELRPKVQAELEVAQRLLDAGVPRSDLYAHFMHAAQPGTATAATPPRRSSDGIADDVRRVVDTKGLPRKGAKDPKVVIVECSDFDCPFCARVGPTLDELLANHPGDVALFYRHLPLAFHKGAEPAARAAVAAQAQGKFWELHDLLFAHQGERSEADLERLARKAGVSVKKWRKDFRSAATAARVQAEIAACGASDVHGTPGFLVNGRLVSGARPLADFERVVQEELAAGP